MRFFYTNEPVSVLRPGKARVRRLRINLVYLIALL